MTNRQLRQYRMLVRVQEFGAAHGRRFRDDTLADQAFASITAAVSLLETHAVERLTTRRRSAKERAAARAALVHMMERISRTALVLARRDPKLVNTFLMPARESAEAVLTTARSFARDVEPLAAQFRARAFSTTFPQDFTQLLLRYEEAFKAREQGKAVTAATRASILAAIAAGLDAARDLDIIVDNELSADPVATAEWRRSRRVGYAGGKEPPSVAVPTTESTTVTSAASPSGPPRSEDNRLTGDALAISSEATPIAFDVSDREDEVDAIDEEAA